MKKWIALVSLLLTFVGIDAQETLLKMVPEFMEQCPTTSLVVSYTCDSVSGGKGQQKLLFRWSAERERVPQAFAERLLRVFDQETNVAEEANKYTRRRENNDSVSYMLVYGGRSQRALSPVAMLDASTATLKMYLAVPETFDGKVLPPDFSPVDSLLKTVETRTDLQPLTEATGRATRLSVSYKDGNLMMKSPKYVVPRSTRSEFWQYVNVLMRYVRSRQGVTLSIHTDNLSASLVSNDLSRIYGITLDKDFRLLFFQK